METHKDLQHSLKMMKKVRITNLKGKLIKGLDISKVKLLRTP